MKTTESRSHWQKYHYRVVVQSPEFRGPDSFRGKLIIK